MAKFIRWALYAGEDPLGLTAVEARQLSLLRKSQWLVSLVALLFLLMAARQAIEVRIIGLSFGFMLTVVGLVLAGRKQYRWVATHLSLLGVLVCVLTACFTNGGLGSVASAWLLYLPVVAGVMGGMLAARLWVGVILLAFLALWGLEVMGIEAPNLTKPEFQYWQNHIQQFMQGVAVAMSLSALIGQVELSESTLLKTIDSLNEEVVARVQAEQIARAAENKKTAFFTSMTHELRTPLNAIIGFAALLMKQIGKGALDERGVDALSRVQTNGRDLLALVNNLLSVAKSQDAEPLLQKIHYDIHQQISDLMGDVGSLAAPDVTLVNLCQAKLEICSDKELVRRILINLLGNALKFTQAGKVTIQSHLVDGHLVVSVTDTGPGISDVDASIIFEPYTRGLNQRHIAGTGLGLMLSRQWARMLGGDIAVQSEVGKGSRFDLRLPEECLS